MHNEVSIYPTCIYLPPTSREMMYLPTTDLHRCTPVLLLLLLGLQEKPPKKEERHPKLGDPVEELDRM